MKTLSTILTIFLLAVSSCKKDKLNGEAHSFIGTWQWVRTVGEYTDLTPANTGYSKTLEFRKKGKYEIIVDSKKKESGRLTLDDPDPLVPQKHAMVQFLRNNFFSKKQEFAGNCIIWFSGSDTITIRENKDWTSQDYHVYVRQD